MAEAGLDQAVKEEVERRSQASSTEEHSFRQALRKLFYEEARTEGNGRLSGAGQEAVRKADEMQQRLGAKLTPEQAKRIVGEAPAVPDAELRSVFQELLLEGTGRKRESVATRHAHTGPLLRSWLYVHGEFIRSTTGDLFYLLHDTRTLYRLDSERFLAWLYALTGYNPAGEDFTYLRADCKTEALLYGKVQPVVRVAAWEGTTQVLRVSRFDGGVYVLDGHQIHTEGNGQGALFDDDPSWVPYEPELEREEGVGQVLDWSLEEVPSWQERAASQSLALRVWLLSTFFTELCPTKPLLVLYGERGAGKSMTLRVLLRLLFGPNIEVGGVPEKPDGFTAAAGTSHLLTLDNLDDLVPWLRDKLARITTGVEDYYRKLYTSNELGRVLYRCWPACTSRTSETLRRDDLADRLLILRVKRVEDEVRQPESQFLEECTRRRGAWWGDVLTVLNAVVRELRVNGRPPRSPLRLADWESFGRVVARMYGKGKAWSVFVESLKTAQRDLLLENEPICEALERWLEVPGNRGRELTARGLYEELTAALYGSNKPTSEWPRSARSFAKKFAMLRRDLAARYGLTWREGTTRATRGNLFYVVEDIAEGVGSGSSGF